MAVGFARGRIRLVGTELRDQLQAIPGVASAEVTVRDGDAPLAQIWLDGSRGEDEVRERVSALLGATVPRRPATHEAPTQRRRGLGRGLTDLLSDDDPAPSHLARGPGSDAVRVVGGLVRVAIVESGDGVDVEVEDVMGDTVSAAVGPDGSIDDAVVMAVLSILDVGGAAATVTTSTIRGDEAVVVVVTLPSGERLAGAALVGYGRPWAVARAVAQAVMSS